MKRESVRIDIVKQSHFVGEKYLCVTVLSFLVTIEWSAWVCRVIHSLRCVIIL